ncbi:MAG: hypothetical protein KAK00_01045 [Nanoarchaeota archaeon]|nr:hypothetical protein [Nanoarchaeota archaeon]
MKLTYFKENKTLRNVFLVLTILLGFVFIVSFSMIYVSDAIKNNNACGCVIPIPYMILMLSSLGLFIGSLSSYLLISKHLRDRGELDKNLEFTLNFLDNDERKIMNQLIENKGELNQSKFEKLTGLHKVKIHRILDKLKGKGLIVKETNGKANKINMKEELKNIFIGQE